MTLAPAPAPGAGTEWRDAFRPSGRPTAVASEPGAAASRFRAAAEAERWRSKLSGAERPPRKDEKLEAYNQPSQAGWARERLLGIDQPSAEQREQDDEDERAKRALALAWSNSAPVDVAAVDRIEQTLQRRLGEVDLQGRAGRQFFADCDPGRAGRVLLLPFVDAMGMKLNFEFPARGSAPSSRAVLAALFERYDLARAGALSAEDFHCALVGATLPGRASGRVVSAIGRIREGLVRRGGGYDALRHEDARWYASQGAGGHPTGCLPAAEFVEGLMRLASLCSVHFSDADLNVIVETFEPPADALGGAPSVGGPWVSYDEFTLAVRGPTMSAARVQLVRAAFAALKDDAKPAKEVRPVHLAARYDTSRHPAVGARLLSEEEAAMALLGAWKDALDEEVTLKEFADRYEWVSPLYASDADFEAMMRAAWRL